MMTMMMMKLVVHLQNNVGFEQFPDNPIIS